MGTLVQQIFHTSQKHLAMEGLGDVRVGSLLITFGTMLFQILCREHDDRNVRGGSIGLQLLRKLQSIHDRHHHIAYHQIGHFLAGYLQSLLAIRCLEHKIIILQKGSLILSDIIIVVYDQYGGLFAMLADELLQLAAMTFSVVDILQCSVIAERRKLVGCCRLWLFHKTFLLSGQQDDKASAFSWFTLCPHLTMMQLYERLDQCQSDARSTRRTLGLEEALEHLGELFLVDTFTRILHLEAKPFSLIRQRHMDKATCRGVLQGIAQKIEDYTGEFLLVGYDVGRR